MLTDIHVALLIMAKNEEKRIGVTLESVKTLVSSVVLYDTGSTDTTIEITRKFCETNKIIFRLKQGEFVDFATSRNVSLDFADTFDDIKFILLLDVNDEIKEPQLFRKEIEKYANTESTGFLVSQEWWSGRLDKYFNIRLVKAREGWRYRGRVHEWMKNTKFPDDSKAPVVYKLDEKAVIFQDRTKDDDRSFKRFYRDKELLLSDYRENPNEPRTVFYLAQTCGCLGELEEALYYYKIRVTLLGFWEEVFHSYLRAGELTMSLKLPWSESLSWFMKALEHSNRAEPAVHIAQYYKHQKNWVLAHTFIILACKLEYPHHCVLFVNKQLYDYIRWQEYGIIGFYVADYKEGEAASRKALSTNINPSVDKEILQFYIDRNNKLEKEAEIEKRMKLSYRKKGK